MTKVGIHTDCTFWVKTEGSKVWLGERETACCGTSGLWENEAEVRWEPCKPRLSGLWYFRAHCNSFSQDTLLLTFSYLTTLHTPCWAKSVFVICPFDSSVVQASVSPLWLDRQKHVWVQRRWMHICFCSQWLTTLLIHVWRRKLYSPTGKTLIFFCPQSRLSTCFIILPNVLESPVSVNHFQGNPIFLLVVHTRQVTAGELQVKHCRCCHHESPQPPQ